MSYRGYERVRKWRRNNRLAWNSMKARNYKRGAAHRARWYMRWTAAEDKKVIETDGQSDRELSRELGRTVESIQIRRCRLLKNACAAVSTI